MVELSRYHIEKVKFLLENFPAVAIIGARQVGKTSLAKHICPDWYYLDLEDSRQFDAIEHDIHFYFENHKAQVIIDEAQELPALFPALRGIIDADRNQKGRFLITGSSSPQLMKQISETLAGRIAIVELGTLKTGEQCQKPISPFYQLFESQLSKDNLPKGSAPLNHEDINNRWFYGGYPEATANFNNALWSQWMENYNATYVNRDIAKLFPRLNTHAYRRFLQTLCFLSGTILNKADLGRAIEVTESTIKQYLQIAEGTFLWRQIPSYEKSGVKSIIKMPRGHLRDSGLLHYLLRLGDLEQLRVSPYVGHSFESYVIEEILQGLGSTLVSNWQPYYYRTKSGAEIDLILEGPFGLFYIRIFSCCIYKILLELF